MFTRTALCRARVVAAVVLLAGAVTLGLACGTSSHAAARAVQVSAGGDHTCALRSNHKVECWGANSSGQLGDGKTTKSATPVPVNGVTNASAIGAGGLHTCAVLSNHRVECWGDNSSGQLGNVTAMSGSTPVPVKSVANATQVSAGYLHSCVLLSNHKIECWGNGYDGELGSGYSNSATPAPVSPMDVLVSRSGRHFHFDYARFTGLSGGGFHTCALVSDHTVACWGRNTGGEVVNGTMMDSADPQLVGGFCTPLINPSTHVVTRCPARLTNVTAVSAGSTHTCALLSNHEIECWGLNSDGQLGDGTTTDRTTQVPVKRITNAVQVSAGGDHTCALLSDHTVECWGSNGKGQLGNGTAASSSTPVLVKGVTNAIQVSAGGSHTCALLSNQRIKCWGSNASGQLGNGKTKDSSIPVSVIGLR